MADLSMKVQNLVTPEGEWSYTIVQLLFPSYEAEAILDIPLNRRGGCDIRFWIGSMNGKYSVKSGYLMEQKNLVPPPFQSSQPFQQWCKLI